MILILEWKLENGEYTIFFLKLINLNACLKAGYNIFVLGGKPNHPLFPKNKYNSIRHIIFLAFKQY